MYEVTVKIGGNASKYWASLEFDDAKGKTHRKEIARERSATKSNNTLQALIDALGILRNPCVLTIPKTMPWQQPGRTDGSTPGSSIVGKTLRGIRYGMRSSGSSSMSS